jgi:hypothetical protein
LNQLARPVSVSTGWRTPGLLALALFLCLPLGRVAAQAKPQAKTVFTAEAVMVPMDHLGPQSRAFDPRQITDEAARVEVLDHYLPKQAK